MKIQFLITLVLLYSSCSSTVKSAPTPYEVKANVVCEAIKSNPTFDYKKHFDKRFRDAVPYETMVSVFKDIYQNFGSCEGVKINTEDNQNGMFFTKHKKDIELRFIMNIKNEQVIGLLYKGKALEPIVFKSKEEIYNAVAKNPHRLRLLFRKLGGGAYLEHNQKGGEALGSVFKLYVLAALVEKINNGELKWDQKFPIQEKYKSLPSGRMQDLKPGTMISIKKFAAQMISISDNTATDHLIMIVGKKYIENHMRTNRLNNYWRKTIPFLTTLEMFKTRGFFSKKQAQTYAKSNRSQRVAMISKTPYKNRKHLLDLLSSWQEPRYNQTIEWFASANNICDLLDWTDKQSNDGFRKAIGLNTPFIDLKKSKRWKYAGFKGGSEPGVLELSYLLEDKKGERWCFYLGQSSTKEAFEQEPFFALAEGVLNFLDNQ